MKNSIEEDIILLKDFTEGNFKRDKLENYKGSYKMGYFYYKDIQQAIEHILSDYKKVLKENEELKSENRRLKVIRYSTEYGTENIHLITKSDLVQIDISKYMIEIEKGKFVDLKQVYQENIELKNNIRKNENELEFDVNCDWITLQKMLDESEKSNEYISYKNEKWIKEKYCIPIQKVKEKIRKNEEIIDISNDGDLIHELLQKNKVYEELLESEK